MFGERLKMARLASGMTQRELAKKIFVSYQAVGKWERGEATPNPEMIVQIAQFLGVSSSELLGEVREAPVRDSTVVLRPTDVKRLTVAEVDMVMAYRAAPAEVRRIIDGALEPYKKATASSAG